MGIPKKEVCCGCKNPIEDRFLLRVMNNSWHESCLHCCVCLEPLRYSCFIKDSQFFCKVDYDKLYGVRCGGCMELIPANEMVMKALNSVYHVRCFACVVCGHRLQKGDHFVISEDQIFCRLHFEKKLAMLDLQAPVSNEWFNAYKSGDESSLDDCDADQPKGPKRPRTILTTSQRRKFKASFEVNPKPCRKVRETLAAETGLSVRVVQVWFQNQRAKMKKLARRQTEDNQSGDRDKKTTGNGKNKKKKDDEAGLNESPVPPCENNDDLSAPSGESHLLERKVFQGESHMTKFAPQICQDESNGMTYEMGMTSSLTAGVIDSDDMLLTSSGIHSKSLCSGKLSGLESNPIDRLYSMQSLYFSND